MNFYDKIHELVKSFKDTNEYKEYMNLKNQISVDEKLYSMLKDFKEKQREHQMEYINTGKINEEKQKELQNLYSILIQNEAARKILECEIRLDVLLADMQKIIADGIKEIIEF
jgi:cell fate (sporulation/competence/biofilm development) regulator YlbF (YheA/YmcA/DUF963 family)